jgi:SH3-like domain-containing protein
MLQRYVRNVILILAIFVVPALFTSVSAWAGEAPDGGLVPCDCTAYVIDTDPKGLNVRSGPGTDYPIAATIPTHSSVEVWITGSVGSWMSIERAYIFADDGSMTEDVDKKVAGFVFGPLLAVQTLPEGLKPIPLFAEPDAASGVITKIPMDTEVTLTGCRGAWVKVKYGNIEGWLGPESHCGNPVTTCVKRFIRGFVVGVLQRIDERNEGAAY